MQEKETSNLTIGGILQNHKRLKQAALAVFEHLKSNAAVYFNLIGALTDTNYTQAIFWLKVLLFRLAIGEIQKRLKGQERNKNEGLKKKERKIQTLLSRSDNDK
jgi:hypothetical protein